MNFVHFSTKMNNPLQYHTTNNIAKSGFCRYVHRVDFNCWKNVLLGCRTSANLILQFTSSQEFTFSCNFLVHDPGQQHLILVGKHLCNCINWRCTA